MGDTEDKIIEVDMLSSIDANEDIQEFKPRNAILKLDESMLRLRDATGKGRNQYDIQSVAMPFRTTIRHIPSTSIDSHIIKASQDFKSGTFQSINRTSVEDLIPPLFESNKTMQTSKEELYKTISSQFNLRTDEDLDRSNQFMQSLNFIQDLSK